MNDRRLCAIAERSGYLADGPLSEVDYRDLTSVSQQFMTSYAKMVEMGLPPKSITIAMLGATINLFEAFGLEDQLPELLRATADMLEYPGQPS